MDIPRKVLLPIGMLIGGLALLVLSGCGEEKVEEAAPVVRPVKTMVVGGAQGFGLSYPGKVQASQRVNLSFRVSGPLIEFPVNEGDRVEKGRLLARIDPRDYKIALDEAKAKYIEAQADYNRYRELYEREAVSLADLDLRRAKRDTAKARLDDAQANLKDTYLKAPFSGFVGTKFVENFQYVQAQENILSLHDVSHVEIVVDIPESLIAIAGEEGTRVRVRIFATFESAPGRELPVEVKEISAEADPRTQTYRVTVTMPQPEGINVLPGMTAQVNAKKGTADDDTETSSFFVIPSIAVFAGDTGKQYVWLVDQDALTVHRREVRVGEVTGTDSIRILGGIKSGEMIAITGVTQLQEGMKIRLMGK